MKHRINARAAIAGCCTRPDGLMSHKTRPRPRVPTKWQVGAGKKQSTAGCLLTLACSRTG